MSDQINTREYEMFNGKKPRGRGQWAFRLSTDHGTIIFVWNGTYSDASRRAMDRAEAVGAYKVTVGA